MKRKLKILLVDDEADALSLSGTLSRLKNDGVVEAATLSSLEDLMNAMGISFDGARKEFTGTLRAPFDSDIVFLDWRLTKPLPGGPARRPTTIPSVLSAFAFIPAMQATYRWAANGEVVEIVPYSTVWDDEICGSLEGYLLSLQLKKQSQPDDLDEVLFRKGLNIVGRMTAGTQRLVLNSVNAQRNDEFVVYPGVTMSCAAMFPMLAIYAGDGYEGVLEDWIRKIGDRLEVLTLRSSPLCAYLLRPRFTMITHGAVGGELTTAGRGAGTARQTILDLIDAELAELATGAFLDGEGATLRVSDRAQEFVRDQLVALKSLLRSNGPPDVEVNSVSQQLRRRLKEGLRFRYANEPVEGYARFADVVPVPLDPPPNGRNWCSFAHSGEMTDFLMALLGQLKGNGRLTHLVLDEEREVALWHFVQDELVVNYTGIRDSAKWESIWTFAALHGALYVCVTSKDENGDTTSSWWSKDLRVVCPTSAEDSAFVFALPVWAI